jgi:hypothetical protein
MEKWKVVCLFGILLGCSRAPVLPDNTDSSIPLPDLRIQKIEYRQLHRQPLIRRSVRDPTLAKLEYEFTLLIENIGEKRMDEPFYVSVSGSLNDYQDYLYSRHIRLNDEQQSFEPGKIIPFVVPLVLDFPPLYTRMSHYPVRFYLNTEGPNNSTGYPTVFIAERSYRNNVLELQVKIKP